MNRIRTAWGWVRGLTAAQIIRGISRAFFIGAFVVFVVSSRSNDSELERQNTKLQHTIAEVQAQQEQLDQALADIVASRDEARLTVCIKDNKQSDDAAAYALGQAEVLIAAAFKGRTPTPAEQAENDAYRAGVQAAARVPFPTRPCDKASIDAYYKGAAK